MKMLIASLLLFSCTLLPYNSHAQITCAQLGKFTSCSGPGGQSTIQSDLGNNMGVIIGRETTTPYTVLPSTPRATPRSAPPVFIPTPSPSTSYQPTMPSVELTMPTTYGYEAPSYGY